MSQTDWRAFITDAKIQTTESQHLTEQQVLTEGAISRASWEFCKYLGLHISGVLLVTVIFFAWLVDVAIFRPLGAILGFVGGIPSFMTDLITEVKKAKRIYDTKHELSPEEIQRVKAAAQRVYSSVGPRTKNMITRYSNLLSRMDLNSTHAKDDAAKMVIALKDVVARKEGKS